MRGLKRYFDARTGTQKNEVELGRIRLDMDARRCFVDQVAVDLTAREFRKKTYTVHLNQSLKNRATKKQPNINESPTKPKQKRKQTKHQELTN